MAKKKLANIATEKDEIEKEISKRFKNRIKENALPMDEARMLELLGKLAVIMRKLPFNESTALTLEKIKESIYLPDEDMRGFLQSSQYLGFLIKNQDESFQFADLVVRDHFAVPELIKYLESDYSDRGTIRDSAANALIQIGDIAVPQLIKALTHTDNGVSSGASYVLQEIGPKAVPGILSAIDNTDTNVRRRAISALSSYENSNAALPQLIKLAQNDPNMIMRVFAINALGNSKNSEAIPVLIQLLNDNKTISNSAVDALKNIGTPEALKVCEEYQLRKGKE